MTNPKKKKIRTKKEIMDELLLTDDAYKSEAHAIIELLADTRDELIMANGFLKSLVDLYFFRQGPKTQAETEEAEAMGILKSE